MIKRELDKELSSRVLQNLDFERGNIDKIEEIEKTSGTKPEVFIRWKYEHVRIKS